MTSLETLEKRLGVAYKNKELLLKAITHRSYLNENNDIDEHNERLEYLGDAVLEFLVSKYLFVNYPSRQEGELTSFRSAIVKTESLSEISRELSVGNHLRMSKGEEKTGGRAKDYLLANTFESILGSMYLDQGMRTCEAFLNRVLFPKIKTIVEQRLDIDPKTQLQELAQEIFKLTPTYELLSEKGPDHNKEFTMGVFIGPDEFGRGTGASKQRAEEAAARQGLLTVKKKTAQKPFKTA